MSGCGCVLGYYHCPLADALWAAVNAAYEAWKASCEEEDWRAYLEAKKAYGDHVETARRQY